MRKRVRNSTRLSHNQGLEVGTSTAVSKLFVRNKVFDELFQKVC